MVFHVPDTDRQALADLAECEAMIRGGSRTFFAASMLLTPRIRQPAYALYAFCRLADDAVDLGHDRLAALSRLEERLDRAYRGCPLDFAADRAFALTVERFAVPRTLPEALLEGLRWDAEARVYDDLPALEAYATRVAGTVGAMMTLIMGVRDATVLARATDLGIAMQLTNIARDVGEDAANGRLYLPRSWLADAGIDADAWCSEPFFDERLAAVVRRLLTAADRLYTRATPGIAMLPLACRPAMLAARRLYAEIGREVARARYDSLSRRAVVPARRKAALLARSFVEAPLLVDYAAAPALPAAQFLIDAVEAATPPAPPDIPWWEVSRGVGRMLELIAVAEARNAAQRSLRNRARPQGYREAEA
jgi:phytoene synthase